MKSRVVNSLRRAEEVLDWLESCGCTELSLVILSGSSFLIRYREA